jgi:large subunit ribosomal protein L4
MKISVYNQVNQMVKEIDLPEAIYNVRFNSDLVHQAVLVYLANRREKWAHTKDRGEVSGGGKKPWRQKGTGRARHGSIRSPLWKGGGVTFGPRNEKNFTRKINKKMKRLALFSVLSMKIRDNELKVIDQFSGLEKAKDWYKILQNLVDLRSKSLLVMASSNNIKKRVGNIKNIDAISSHSLNVYDLLRNRNILIEEKALEEIESYYKLK